MRKKLKLLVLFVLMVWIVQGQYEFEYTKNPGFSSDSKLWNVTRFTDSTDAKSKLFTYILVYNIRPGA